ncbi:MAG: cysteine hydrolase [Bdellovibrio sp.]|nr:cysteine hydrolase [Bdellovibrio sp.]
MIDLSSIDKTRAALLVMHYQADVFSALAGVLPNDMKDRANMFISDWRKTGRPVIFANMAMGANYEAVNPHNLLTVNVSNAGLFREAAPRTVLESQASDKHYFSARGNVFHGNDLDKDLRAQGIDTLVMAGIASSGVLFSTVAWASDADYRMYLVRDCCFDPDTAAHDALFRTSFAARALIV